MRHPIARLLGIDAPSSGLRYLSVCSGIEAATTAWHGIGWTPVAFSEIEKFPSAVLAHHWPHVPNLGDMTRWREWPEDLLASCDLIVGGTPCQAFSVAGLRKSLDDDRGNLTLTYVHLIDHIDRLRTERGLPPVIIVWENVPGVLSTKDNAFGCFLSAIAGDEQPLEPGPRPEHGKSSLHWRWCKKSGVHRPKWSNAGHITGPARSAAWRVLDAQHFGVPQRRRRVFLVGSARDGFCPGEVLFESEGMRRDSTPRREAGQDTAENTGEGATGGGGWPAEVAPTLNAHFGEKQGIEDQHALGGGRSVCPIWRSSDQVNAETLEDMAGTLNCNKGQRGGIVAGYASKGKFGGFSESETSDSLRAQGGDGQIAGALAAEAGMKQQNYIYQTNPCYRQESGVASTHASTTETDAIETLRKLREEIGEEVFAQWGLGILDSFQSEKVLRSALHGSGFSFPTFSRCWMVYCSLTGEGDRAAGAVQSVREAESKRRSPQRWKLSEQLAQQLGAYLSRLSQPGASTSQIMRDLWEAAEGPGLLRQALSKVQEMGRPADGEGQSAQPTSAVRRLTCEECEFLQGFPHHHTLIPWRGKDAEACPDGPRYKALGNSMAVPCMKFIGERIAKHLSE